MPTNSTNYGKTEANTFYTITVAYWHGVQFDDLPYVHRQSYPYSARKRNSIIDTILSNGYRVMLHPSGEELIIWIDKWRFGQK